MKRLLEESPVDPAERQLIELVRQAAPTQPNPLGQRRIRLRLEAARMRRPRRWRRLAPWLVGAGLLGSGTALAAWGARWLNTEESAARDDATLDEQTSATNQKVGTAALAPSSRDFDEGLAPVIGEPNVAEEAAEPLDAESSRTASAPQNTQRRREASPRNAVSETRADTPQRAGGSAAEDPTAAEDPSPVVAAIRAWRSERDAPRARALLTGYLRQHPRGALAEDALALLIEVSSAQKDPSAVRHAQRYLRAYPRGRFRSVAERVVQGAGPGEAAPR